MADDPNTTAGGDAIFQLATLIVHAGTDRITDDHLGPDARTIVEDYAADRTITDALYGLAIGGAVTLAEAVRVIAQHTNRTPADVLQVWAPQRERPDTT